MVLQLWRMTPGGMIQHEGSSPPQDPKKTNGGSGVDTVVNGLVLDIAGPAVQPQSYVPLMLRRPDERRQLTQKWKFTDDGRLVCAHPGLFVQAKDGFAGMAGGKTLKTGLCHLCVRFCDTQFEFIIFFTPVSAGAMRYQDVGSWQRCTFLLLPVFFSF